MFKLRKTDPPLGTEAAPLYEATYSEGLIKVVDGFCEVRDKDSRARLIELGYHDTVDTEVQSSAGVVNKVLATVKGKGRR